MKRTHRDVQMQDPVGGNVTHPGIMLSYVDACPDPAGPGFRGPGVINEDQNVG